MTDNGELKVGVLTPAQAAKARADGKLIDRKGEGEGEGAEVQSRSVEVEEAGAGSSHEALLIGAIVLLVAMFIALKLTMRDLEMHYDDPYASYSFEDDEEGEGPLDGGAGDSGGGGGEGSGGGSAGEFDEF
eukprot:CAMPEP_0119512718 /NCGR_PEP_ID=MMETSP1344-20130328/31026_1 /TAXON_ID=236787 /ORGANISM="Florenciella parvula, Strain CCMP2471" /LENGTH=130 /DNA_ID=CAMNT_0007549867 /DNA_START=15 /DNA_END=407 /DNA_ORIENTATION=+